VGFWLELRRGGGEGVCSDEYEEELREQKV